MVVLGEFGPHEGMITPRFSRYWFENIGDEDLEILQVAAFGSDRRGGWRFRIVSPNNSRMTATAFNALARCSVSLRSRAAGTSSRGTLG